jgi:hypothetical protein
MRESSSTASRTAARSNAISKPPAVPLAVPCTNRPVLQGIITPCVGRKIAGATNRCCAGDYCAGCAVTSAAAAQMMTPGAMSAPACFRDVGCHRRCRNGLPTRANRCARRAFILRREHRSRNRAWRSRRDRGFRRLRHGVWAGWIEDRRRWGGNGIHKLRLRLSDCYAEQRHPSGHEILRRRHPLKSRCQHRGLLLLRFMRLGSGGDNVASQTDSGGRVSAGARKGHCDNATVPI